MTDPARTFDGIDSSGTVVSERELFDLMWQAASQATLVCQSEGYGLADKVTKDSARAAAEEVYLRFRPHDPPRRPVPDIVQERMEREPAVPLFDGDMPD